MSDKCFICKRQVSDDCIMVTLEDYGLRYVCSDECLDKLVDRIAEERNTQYVEAT